VEVLLERDQPVDVLLDGGWHLSARVAAVARDYVDFAPLDAPFTLPGDLRWCGATVSWATRIGAASRHGILVHLPEGDTLRLHPVGDPEKVQRREFVRVPAELSTAMICPDKRLTARTLDVSVGGMLVAPADKLVLDDHVRFALDLGALTIAGAGIVVRGDDEGTRGIRFAELQGRSERAISRYVAQRQRELLADAPPRDA
jgi:hypothetical protein